MKGLHIVMTPLFTVGTLNVNDIILALITVYRLRVSHMTVRRTTGNNKMILLNFRICFVWHTPKGLSYQTDTT